MVRRMFGHKQIGAIAPALERGRAPAGLVAALLAAQAREREMLRHELVQVRALMPLLMKQRNGGIWSREERRQLHRQLRALAYLSPYLVLLLLPGSFVFLPLLAWWLDRRRLRRGETLPPAPL